MILGMISLNSYLILGTVLFAIGLMGLMLRRSILMMMMGIELMLNAVVLIIVSAASAHGDVSAQVFVFFIMIVAAAEVAVGLSVLTFMYRHTGSIDGDAIRQLKG